MMAQSAEDTTATKPGDTVSTGSQPWHPLAPGVFMKVLRCSDETALFTVMIKAEAGSVLPRHKHLGPAEIYILEGRASHPQTGENVAGDYIYEHTGAVHEPVQFDEDVVLFMINHGPSAFLNDDDSVKFVMDVGSARAMMLGEARH